MSRFDQEPEIRSIDEKMKKLSSAREALDQQEMPEWQRKSAIADLKSQWVYLQGLQRARVANYERANAINWPGAQSKKRKRWNPRD